METHLSQGLTRKEEELFQALEAAFDSCNNESELRTKARAFFVTRRTGRKAEDMELMVAVNLGCARWKARQKQQNRSRSR